MHRTQNGGVHSDTGHKHEGTAADPAQSNATNRTGPEHPDRIDPIQGQADFFRQDIGRTGRDHHQGNPGPRHAADDLVDGAVSPACDDQVATPLQGRTRQAGGMVGVGRRVDLHREPE